MLGDVSFPCVEEKVMGNAMFLGAWSAWETRREGIQRETW